MKVYTLSLEEGEYSDYSYSLLGLYNTLELAKEAVTRKHGDWIVLHEVENENFRPEKPTWECGTDYWDASTYTIVEWEI